jgi:hypothetical protein
MNFNPYQAPTSAYDGGFQNYGSPSGGVSDRTVAALRKTRPWVVLIAVIGLVFSGFMALASLVIMTEMAAAGVAYLVMAGLYVLPAVALIRYGNAINKLMHGGGVAELEQALDAQASFWQIAGIYTLIGMVITVIGVIGVIAVGAAFTNF